MGGAAGRGSRGAARCARRHLRNRADARHRDRDCARTACPRPSCRGAILSSSPSPARWPTAAAPGIWSPACARPTIPAIPIAATTPSRPCSSRSISAWTRRFVIHTPLMWIDKAATSRLPKQLTLLLLLYVVCFGSVGLASSAAAAAVRAHRCGASRCTLVTFDRGVEAKKANRGIQIRLSDP